MAWDKTYSHTVLIAVDQLGAAVFFNRPDLTISTMCWMVMEGRDATLKLNAVQRWCLKEIGAGLEWGWPGHCAAARQGDRDRATSALEATHVPDALAVLGGGVS